MPSMDEVNRSRREDDTAQTVSIAEQRTRGDARARVRRCLFIARQTDTRDSACCHLSLRVSVYE